MAIDKGKIRTHFFLPGGEDGFCGVRYEDFYEVGYDRSCEVSMEVV